MTEKVLDRILDIDEMQTTPDSSFYLNGQVDEYHAKGGILEASAVEDALRYAHGDEEVVKQNGQWYMLNNLTKELNGDTPTTVRALMFLRTIDGNTTTEKEMPKATDPIAQYLSHGQIGNRYFHPTELSIPQLMQEVYILFPEKDEVGKNGSRQERQKKLTIENVQEEYQAYLKVLGDRDRLPISTFERAVKILENYEDLTVWVEEEEPTRRLSDIPYDLDYYCRVFKIDDISEDAEQLFTVMRMFDNGEPTPQDIYMSGDNTPENHHILDVDILTSEQLLRHVFIYLGDKKNTKKIEDEIELRGLKEKLLAV